MQAASRGVAMSRTAGTTSYLIRHADAGVRGSWPGHDHLRPLSPLGWRQAWHLVDRLAGKPITGLLSSPYVRCRQTLEPLARVRGLPITIVDELAEGVPVADVVPVLEQASTGPLALCSHGDIIEQSLGFLLATGMRPRSPIVYEKGSIWLLERSGGSFVEGRYLGPTPTA
jgi:8-oxo-dGTP diphosphatase